MTLRFSQYLLSAVAAAFFVLCSLSSTAYASLDEYDFIDEEIRIQIVSTAAGSGLELSTGVLSGNTTTKQLSHSINPNTSFSFFDVFSFYNETEPLVEKDYTLNINFDGIVAGLASGNPSSGGTVSNSPFVDLDKMLYTVVLYDKFGNPWVANKATVEFIHKDKTSGMRVEISIPNVQKDVYGFDLQYSYAVQNFGLTPSTTANPYPHLIGFRDFGCTWSFQAPADGLIKEVLKEVLELPKNMWGFFEDGLQKLFIPGEEEMYLYKSKWEQLLEDHLGVIYQAGGVVGEYVEAFGYSEKSTIHVPPVTLHFGQTEWTFGDWEVQIVPPGFDVLYDILRIITAFLATALFVNAMKSRFERLVGGDGNA